MFSYGTLITKSDQKNTGTIVTAYLLAEVRSPTKNAADYFYVAPVSSASAPFSAASPTASQRIRIVCYFRVGNVFQEPVSSFSSYAAFFSFAYERRDLETLVGLHGRFAFYFFASYPVALSELTDNASSFSGSHLAGCQLGSVVSGKMNSVLANDFLMSRDRRS